MKPRPTTIQPGATHWNPNAGPDWYRTPYHGRWQYFEEADGAWVVSIGAEYSEFIPVEELMAQQVVNIAEQASPTYEAALSEGRKAAGLNAGAAKAPQWNGEGLPPVGTACEVMLESGKWERCKIVATVGSGSWITTDSADRVIRNDLIKFRPIKSERDQQIDALLSVIQSLPNLAFRDDFAEALYDKGVRVEK